MTSQTQKILARVEEINKNISKHDLESDDSKAYLINAELKIISEAKWLTEAVKELSQALDFYCAENSYDYDKVQGANYIWNDQGRIARTVIAEVADTTKGE